MWNPETYRDTDYGLDQDERFEPTDDLEEEFLPEDGEPYIETVLGPIRPDEAGVTLVREYLQHDGADGSGERLEDMQAALLDLEAFFSASGRTIVSAAASGTGRDAKQLRWLAQHAPVHIVGATGFPIHGAGRFEDAAKQIKEDLVRGMDGTGSRAGVLTTAGQGALNHDAISVIAALHVTHGTTIIADASDGRGALAMVGEFTSRGVDPSRIVTSFTDIDEGSESVRELLDAGVSVLFGRLGQGDDTRTAQTIVRLVEAGHRDQIVLSHGFTRKAHLTGYGGRPGFPYVVEYFAVMLLEAGLEAQDVRSVLVDNAARALTLRHRA